MANRHDYQSVVEAKRNEMEINNLDQYYGEVNTLEAHRDLIQAYDYYEVSDERSTLILSLEETMVPKYVRLARFLREVSVSRNFVDYKQAQIMLGSKENEYTLNKRKLKTLYREFKQIERDYKKLSRKNAKKLQKFKDVQNFVYGQEIDDVCYRLRSSGIGYNKEALTRFFDSCTELDFLDKSRLTKNVR